jgi:hypothetical protein
MVQLQSRKKAELHYEATFYTGEPRSQTPLSRFRKELTLRWHSSSALESLA